MNDGIDVLSTNAYLAMGVLADAIGPNTYHNRDVDEAIDHLRTANARGHADCVRTSPSGDAARQAPTRNIPGDTTDQGPTTSHPQRRQQHDTTDKQAGGTSG